MSLVTWNPLRDLELLLGRTGREFPPAIGDGSWVPSVDISENDKEYLITADLAGVDSKDIKLSTNNGVLSLAGERHASHEVEGEKYHRSERFSGRFERSFSLPDDVSEEQISADCKNGVMSIHLPKADISRSGSRQIPVN